MLTDIFGILIFVSIACLIVGLIKPSVYQRFIKGAPNRLKIFGFFTLGAIVFFIFAGIASTTIDREGLSKRVKEDQAREQQTDTETKSTQPETKVADKSQPVDLGKWFGKTDVLVGKTDNGYLATFDPALPKDSVFVPPMPESFKGTPIFAYLINLVDYAYGKGQLLDQKPHFADSNGTGLITYDANDGSTFYFLLVNDEKTQQVAGVNFWKK